jgi:MFS family permease
MNQTIDESTFQKIHNYGRIILVACFMIGLIAISIRLSISVFFNSIETDLQLNRVSTSGLTSIGQIIGCIVCLIAGWSLDHFGSKKVFVIAGIISGIGLLVSIWVNSIWQLYISYGVFFNLGSNAVSTLSSVVVAKWFPTKQSQALGIVSSAGSIGLIVSAPVLTSLIAFSGWRLTFLILAIIVFIIWIPSALLLKPNPESEISAKRDSLENIGRFSKLKYTLKSKAYWLVFISTFLHGWSLMTFLTHIVPHTINLGFSASQAAIIFSIIGITSLVTKLTIGAFSDNLGLFRVVLISIISLSISVLMLLFVSNIFWLYITAIVWGLGFGTLSPAWTSVMVENSKGKHLGTIFGTLDSAFAIGAALGPIVSGYLFVSQGNYNLAFGLAYVILLLSIFPIFSLYKSQIT